MTHLTALIFFRTLKNNKNCVTSDLQKFNSKFFQKNGY